MQTLAATWQGDERRLGRQSEMGEYLVDDAGFGDDLSGTLRPPQEQRRTSIANTRSRRLFFLSFGGQLENFDAATDEG